MAARAGSGQPTPLTALISVWFLSLLHWRSPSLIRFCVTQINGTKLENMAHRQVVNIFRCAGNQVELHVLKRPKEDVSVFLTRKFTLMFGWREKSLKGFFVLCVFNQVVAEIRTNQTKDVIALVL